MKPKKTTAPSDSQRDSQDWSKEFDKPNFWPDLKPIQKAGIKDFIQQEKDKSFQAGFQEAVEKIQKTFQPGLCYTYGNVMQIIGIIQGKIPDSLKPTQGDKDA